jgi:HK97 gp10 family phage protein
MANDQALKGVAALITKLQDIGALDDGKALRAGVRAGMRPALLAAREKIPVSRKPHRVYTGEIVQPGFAKSTLRIITTVSPDKQQATALMSVRKKAFYATSFVELGTSRASPQPWLRPAFYSTQEAIKQALADKLAAYLAKVQANSGAGKTSSDP